MAEKKEEKGVPMKCAFDQTRVCNGSCVAFFAISTGTSSQIGCKRMGAVR